MEDPYLWPGFCATIAPLHRMSTSAGMPEEIQQMRCDHTIWRLQNGRSQRNKFMPSHPSTENKASTDEAFGSKVLSGAGVSWIQRINIHDFTISDAVGARIYKNWAWSKYLFWPVLCQLPTTLYTNKSRDPSVVFFLLDAKHIVFTPLYTLYQYAPPVWLCFSSLLEVCFLKTPRKLLPGNFYPFIFESLLLLSSSPSSFHNCHSFSLCWLPSLPLALRVVLTVPLCAFHFWISFEHHGSAIHHSAVAVFWGKSTSSA